MNLVVLLFYFLARLSDGDRLQRLSLFTECLVLFDLFLVSVYKVVVSDIHELRFVHGIIVNGRIVGVQHFVLLKLRIRNRDRRDQGMGVWMQREVEQLLCVRNLYDISFVDNTDTVGNEPYDGKVMGDKQISNLFFSLEFLQQIEDLGTDRYVQCGDRLIGYNQLRLHNHGTGQTDTLALSAGELMWVTGQVLRQKTNFVDHVLYLFHTVCLVLVQMEVVKTLGYDVIDRRTLI